ncbi:hypothetical protein [Labrys sp. 22185]|uniref:hypothetical protein n=1 Tax=Labrys sp. 22185 TaxID=3453888 RepID=UPI003F82CFAF
MGHDQAIRGPNRRGALCALLAGAGATALNLDAGASQVQLTDPAIAAWNRWFTAHRHAVAMCRRQQRLEAILVETIGFPVAPDLAAHQARWDQADRQLGYSAALTAEEIAFQVEERLGDDLFATPARSLIGAIAKLHSVITMEEPSPTDDQSPWPQLRSIRADLERIAAMVKGGN